MDDKYYIPISCDLHSQYELAIMHNKSLLLNWQDEDKLSHEAKVTPLDVITCNRAEYLKVLDSEGKENLIRLDRISKMRIL